MSWIKRSSPGAPVGTQNQVPMNQQQQVTETQ